MKKKKKRVARKKVSKRAASKQGKVNKSEAIRNYKASHPDARPAEIVEGLASRGIVVTANVVSSTLYMARKKGTVGGGRKTAAGRGAQSDQLLESLLAAKKLCEQLGGIEQARQALDLLARLQ